MPRQDPENPALAVNKKAFHDYIVEERFEAGVHLAGTEVKSCRDRAVVIGDAFVQIRNGQAWIVNMHISPYGFGNRFNHDPRQERRLLLHKNEILKLAQNLKTKGGTIIPLRIYLSKGLVKLELAYCHGKTHGDKRETLRERQADMEMRRSVKR
ncbi:MAG: SsrA-binding protein SmpB [Victivallaceae bacterium]|nr:SsrA-binding protein SmpB [Victivallaceae bacterium]